MKTIFVTAVILTLLTIPFAALQLIPSITANPDGHISKLAMPIEHVNYTITTINGTLWATIDGNYPIYILNQSNCTSATELSMVYPMPPETTNIEVKLNGKKLLWANYTEIYPEMLHQTAIGNWWMIQSNLTDLSEFFTLQIHYEHPLQLVDGSYLFLYDLNISPYLSSQSNKSSAYFTLRIETNMRNIEVYTAPPDAAKIDWKPLNYTTTNDGSIVEITVDSEYDKLLRGDIIVKFSKQNNATKFLILVLLTSLIAAVVLVTILISAKRKRSSNVNIEDKI